MDVFSTYLNLGFKHILDLEGYDHLLFLIVLCASYSYLEWRRVGVLVTAFTLGHCITLALATLDIVVPNMYLIELLIPITIFISAVISFREIYSPAKSKMAVARYVLAFVFGLIHGMGFSNFLSFILEGISSIGLPLLYFNIGIELGQLLIIFVYFLLQFLLFRFVNLNQRKLTIGVSAFGGVMASILILARI